MKLLHSPVTRSLFGLNILLSTLFSYILGLRSSLSVKGQDSRPCKRTGETMVLYSLIFTFLDSKLDRVVAGISCVQSAPDFLTLLLSDSIILADT